MRVSKKHITKRNITKRNIKNHKLKKQRGGTDREEFTAAIDFIEKKLLLQDDDKYKESFNTTQEWENWKQLNLLEFDNLLELLNIE
jgi:hypothetical protein